MNHLEMSKKKFDQSLTQFKVDDEEASHAFNKDFKIEESREGGLFHEEAPEPGDQKVSKI